MAVSVCGRSGLWPLRFVAVSVCGRSGFVAVPVCGRSGLWPFRFWPFRFVAVMTRIRHRCAVVNGSAVRHGCQCQIAGEERVFADSQWLCPAWYATIHGCPPTAASDAEDKSGADDN